MHFILPDREFWSVLLLLMEVTGNRTRLGTITAKAVGPGVKADRRPFVCSNKSAGAYFSLFVFNSLLWHHLSHSGMKIHVQSVDGSRWKRLSKKVLRGWTFKLLDFNWILRHFSLCGHILFSCMTPVSAAYRNVRILLPPTECKQITELS